MVDWESKKINLVLFLTLGGSLQQWSKEGILDRELALYKKLKEHDISTSIISFGDKTEEEILIKHPYIKVLYNKYNLHPRLYSYLIPILFFEVFKKADLIRTNQFYGVHLAKRTASLFSKKLIIRQGYSFIDHRLRENRDNPKANKVYEKYVQNNIKAGSAFIFTTNQIYNDYKRKYKFNNKNIRIIPNYIVLNNWKPHFKISKEKKALIYIGRISEQKNLISLSQALKDTNLKLIIVGDGEENEKKDLEKSLSNNKVDFKFFKRTNQNNLKKIINLADAFILPSLYEGNPKILIEMMSYKVPIIATKVPGIDNLVDNKSCLLIPDTSPRSIRQSILEFYKINKEKKKIYIQNAYKVSLKHSLEKICKEESDLYKLLNEK